MIQSVCVYIFISNKLYCIDASRRPYLLLHLLLLLCTQQHVCTLNRNQRLPWTPLLVIGWHMLVHVRSLLCIETTLNTLTVVGLLLVILQLLLLMLDELDLLLLGRVVGDDGR